MIKKLRYFHSEFWRGSFFNAVLFIGTALCMVLIAFCLVEADATKAITALDFSSAAKKDYITFSKYPNTETVDGLRAKIGDEEMNALASACQVYASDSELTSNEVRIISPAVVKNMPSLGLSFKSELPEGYREAYVDKELKNKYKRGDTYELELENGDVINIKIKGYTDALDDYYDFSRYSIIRNSVNIVICDNLPGYAEVGGGLFFNDIPSERYAELGYEVKSAKLAYYREKSSMPYYSVLFTLMLFVAVFVNYMINLDKNRKRFAIKHMVGIDSKTLIFTELLKMTLIFLLGLFAAIAACAVILSLKEKAYQGAIISYEMIAYSALIVFGVYGITVASGIAGLLKIKPLVALKDDIRE